MIIRRDVVDSFGVLESYYERDGQDQTPGSHVREIPKAVIIPEEKLLYEIECSYTRGMLVLCAEGQRGKNCFEQYGTFSHMHADHVLRV